MKRKRKLTLTEIQNTMQFTFEQRISVTTEERGK